MNSCRLRWSSLRRGLPENFSGRGEQKGRPAVCAGQGEIMRMQLQRVYPGSKIMLLKEDYQYTCEFFSREIPEEYIYTYAYQEQQRWLTPVKEGFSEPGGERERCITQDGYVELTVTRANGQELTVEEKEKISELVRVENPDGEEEKRRHKRSQSFLNLPDVHRELEKTLTTIQERRDKDSLVFTLLSDTHYVINGNFEDTATTIEAINRQVKPDGIIHLGDLADGMLGKEQCRQYSGQVLNRIVGWGLPFYFTIGNHDSNYFRKNPERLTQEEQYSYYLQDKVAGRLINNQLWYHQDFPRSGLRFLFLHSFDAAQEHRYGFTPEELEWVRSMLDGTPQDYRVILFSHDAPLARLDYWASKIRNGEALMDILEEWQGRSGGRIMAFIHGHTHADFVYRERKFPIISIGASKCEFFPDKKPEGSVRYRREMGTAIQELWDTMIIHPKEGSIDFIRFGAGEDRHVGAGDQMKFPKIWAHRGASGYAPENTLEAFRLARDMGADGVELDVQFTKDRQLVVIHDETIDRVSDGTGYVADYTLEELKKLHFNKTHPEYVESRIPTLQEVLELLKPTGMTVNIELKTGINFYDGIERQVLKLVEELGMRESVIYSSFNHASVMRVKRLCPGARVGLLYSDGIWQPAEYAERLGAEALHPSLSNMQYPQLMEQCRENGIQVHVWTVNGREDLKRIAEMGADAIITNIPDVAREVIYGDVEAKKVRWEALKAQGIETQEQDRQEENTDGKKKGKGAPNIILHGCGLAYSRVRRVFVRIDEVVQRMAGK